MHGSALVLCDKRVCRVFLAYFRGTRLEEIPYIDVPWGAPAAPRSCSADSGVRASRIANGGSAGGRAPRRPGQGRRARRERASQRRQRPEELACLLPQHALRCIVTCAALAIHRQSASSSKAERDRDRSRKCCLRPILRRIAALCLWVGIGVFRRRGERRGSVERREWKGSLASVATPCTSPPRPPMTGVVQFGRSHHGFDETEIDI